MKKTTCARNEPSSSSCFSCKDATVSEYSCWRRCRVAFLTTVLDQLNRLRSLQDCGLEAAASASVSNAAGGDSMTRPPPSASSGWTSTASSCSWMSSLSCSCNSASRRSKASNHSTGVSACHRVICLCTTMDVQAMRCNFMTCVDHAHAFKARLSGKEQTASCRLEPNSLSPCLCSSCFATVLCSAPTGSLDH